MSRRDKELPIIWNIKDVTSFTEGIGSIIPFKRSGVSWSSYVPQNLTATLITGGVQLDWTLLHNPEALQIYYSSDGVNYTCLGYAVLGTVITYNHYFDGGVTAYYKLRSYKNGIYSPYTGVVSITVPDTDAEAIIARMTALSEEPSTARKTNIRTTIASLKNANLYNDQFDALWISRAHGVGSAKINLINQYNDITWSEKFVGPGGSDESFCHTVCELSNGHLLAGFGNNTGHYYRSINGGAIWVDQGVLCIGEGTIYNICDLGNGIVLAGTGLNGRILRSTDYGYTWTINSSVDAIWVAKGAVAEHQYIVWIKDLGNGIIIAATENSPTPATSTILRSVDYGLTWTDVGQAGTDLTVLNCLCVIGGGIVLVGGGRDEGAGVFTALAHMLRSTDYGATWTDLGHICASAGQVRFVGSAYLDNGIVVVGTTQNAEIFRSNDYGLTWENRGVLKTGEIVVGYIHNIGNGKALAGTNSGPYNGLIFSTDDYGLSWHERSMPEANHGMVEVRELYGKLICFSTTSGATAGKIYFSTNAPFVRSLTNAFDLVGVPNGGTLTFTTDGGFNSDEIKSYLKTNFIPLSATYGTDKKYRMNDFCFGFKVSGTQHSSPSLDMIGVQSPNGMQCYIFNRYGIGAYAQAHGSSVTTEYYQTGYNCISRDNAANWDFHINANTYNYIDAVLGGIPNAEFYFLCINVTGTPNYWIKDRHEIGWLGRSINQALFNTLQTILNANIAAL